MFLLLLTACLADLQPEVITIDAQPEREARGRALLDAAAEAHGGRDAWRAHDTLELVFVDDWYGMAATLFDPWPDASMRGHVVQRPATFDSRVKFLGGAKDGWTWGIEDWQPYTIDPDGAKVESDDADIRFMLPTVHYFVDLPFRLPEAELVRHVGTETVGGQAWEVVYATWGTITKNADYDQYLVYIDPDSGRIGKVKYTVREIAGVVTGTCHLDDVRPVGDLLLAHTMTVTPEPGDDLTADAMHTMRIERARHDSVDPDSWALREGFAPL